MIFLFRLHPAFDALIAYIALFSRMASTLGQALEWSLGFTTAPVAPVRYIIGSVLVVVYSISLAQLYAFPTLQRYTGKVCSRLGIRPRHRTTAPLALLAGLALGLTLCLAALVHHADEVVELLDFVRYGRDDDYDPDYRSYICVEDAAPNRRMSSISGWSYLLRRYWSCMRMDEFARAFRLEIEGITYSNTCTDITWSERADCARQFIVAAFVQRLKASILQRVHVTTSNIRAQASHAIAKMEILGERAGKWILAHAVDALLTALVLAIIVYAAVTYRRRAHATRVQLLRRLRHQASQRNLADATYSSIVQRISELEMQVQAQTRRGRANKEDGTVGMRTLPTIIVTTATPIVERIGATLNGLFDLDSIPDMWWDEESEDDLGSDQVGQVEDKGPSLDCGSSFDSMKTLGDDIGSPTFVSTPVATAGFFSFIRSKWYADTPSPEPESPGMGMGMSSSFSSMCLSDLTKGATEEEKKQLARIDDNSDDEVVVEVVKDVSNESSKIVLFFVFLIGFLSSVYATAAVFLSPVMPSLHRTIVAYYPAWFFLSSSTILGIPCSSFFPSPPSSRYPSAHATTSLRYILFSRLSLLVHFVGHGDATNYKDADYWRCSDLWGNFIEVTGEMEKVTRDKFMQCTAVKPMADDYIEMCDLSGFVGRARCVGWNVVKDFFVEHLTTIKEMDLIIADKTRSSILWITHLFLSTAKIFMENKLNAFLIVALVFSAYMVSRVDENAELEHSREQQSVRLLESTHQTLVSESTHLRSYARKYPQYSRSESTGSLVPQRRDSAGTPIGLGISISSNLTSDGVWSLQRSPKRTTARLVEGRAMLAKLRLEEREKEADWDSDSDVDVDEAVTPTDEVTRMPMVKNEARTNVVDERKVFSFLCPAGRE